MLRPPPLPARSSPRAGELDRRLVAGVVTYISRWAPHFLALLLLARAAMAALTPISADEAYYWLWSKHLDFGYFDHPPLIAWAIRAGTVLFGDTLLGIRMWGLVLSCAASFLVWDSARLVLGDARQGWAAALLFNLSLMVNVEMLAATPDMPSIATSALFLFCLVRLQSSGNAKWWLAVGVAGGLGMLAKYSAGFLGLGALLWLTLDAKARPWLKTPWPWAGGALALLVFLPNLLWQAAHHWETFAFQFGRTATGHLTARFLAEFAGAQLGLASPFILILAVAGLVAAAPGKPQFLVGALVWPAAIYFGLHALHDRVQGNWTAFAYPMLAVLAAGAIADAPAWRRWCSRLAMPVAAAILLLAYAQSLGGFLPLGRNDPLARLSGAGFPAMADRLADVARKTKAGAILTSDYETAAWLRFYRPDLAVIELGETYRYPNSPAPPAALLAGPLIYVAEGRRDRHAVVAAQFRIVDPIGGLAVRHDGVELSRYALYRVAAPTRTVDAKMP